MDSNYELLVAKINSFTRKFYLNQLLRGIIYTLVISTIIYLLSFVLVYYTQPGVYVKSTLFFVGLIVVFFVFIAAVVKPALSYFKLSKSLTLEDAALLIGAHFTDVRDKLLNTLQLKTLADLSPKQNQLIMAGIDQKIDELKPIPFSSAIRFGDNKKYIKYLIIPLSIIFCIGIIAPAILREGTNSYIKYDQQILPEAPFKFKLLNPKLTAVQGDDFKLELQLTGDELPQEVYLQDGTNVFKLEKEGIDHFHYTFVNLQKSKTIQLKAGGFSSGLYLLDVKLRAALTKVTAKLVYPAYLKKATVEVRNQSDLVIPQGTKVTWNIETEHSDHVSFLLNKVNHPLAVSENQATFSSRLLKSSSYQIIPINNSDTEAQQMVHTIEVQPDLAPGIELTSTKDSSGSSAIYFNGNITDDHGFSSLKFIYTVKAPGRQDKTVTKFLPIKKEQTALSFFHFLNPKSLALQSGETLEYFFEVSDNDGVNGFKSVRSANQTLEVPTAGQVDKQLDASSSLLKQKMDGAIKLAAAIEKESKKLSQLLLNKKELTAQDKKEISRLAAQQKQLEQHLEEIKLLKEKNSTERLVNDAVKSILAEKQKQIDALFKKIQDPQSSDLLEKLKELAEQEDKDQTQSQLSKMNRDNKSVKEELDRILELYKQLEFEQGLQQKIDRLKTLSSAQKELSQKTKAAKPKAAAGLKENQKQLSDDFNSLKKDLNQLAEKNQALERPNAFKDPGKETQQIEQLQKESEKQLDNNQTEKAAKTQEKATAALEELAEKLAQEQEQSAEMESNLDVAELRQLIQQLLYNSFEQEKTMLTLKEMVNGDPGQKALVQQQRNIKDNMKTVADSLSALGKRVPQIETAVQTEMGKINLNVDKSLENMTEQRTAAANKNQQQTMTSINNLTLMLNEVLEQLEKSKKNGKKGGKGKQSQSMQQLQQMQQQLNKNMQQAKDKMQQEGNKGKSQKGETSQEFAKMAQQQQMIREALQKINTEKNKDGKGSLGNLNQMAKDMEQTENDLVNKRIEEETIKRQKNLLKNLLTAENAERNQDEDEKRESNIGKQFPPSYPKMLEIFKKKQSEGLEIREQVSPQLNDYYKNRIADYYKLLNLRK